jgi:exonuclease VII large subunit
MGSDDITVRQMLELVVQNFEQQEKTISKLEARLEKQEETLLDLRTKDLQQVKLDLNSLTHAAKHDTSKTELERAFKEGDALRQRIVLLEDSRVRVAKIPDINTRLREMEGLKPKISEVDGLKVVVRLLEDKQTALEGAAKALSPLAKTIIGVLSALLIAALVAHFGWK